MYPAQKNMEYKQMYSVYVVLRFHGEGGAIRIKILKRHCREVIMKKG